MPNSVSIFTTGIGRLTSILMCTLYMQVCDYMYPRRSQIADRLLHQEELQRSQTGTGTGTKYEISSRRLQMSCLVHSNQCTPGPALGPMEQGARYHSRLQTPEPPA